MYMKMGLGQLSVFTVCLGMYALHLVHLAHAPAQYICIKHSTRIHMQVLTIIHV